MSRPRLVHVITRLCVGGAQLTLLESAKDLADEYAITIVHGPDTGDEGSIEDVARASFPTYLVPSLRRDIRPREDVHAIRVLREIFRRELPTIIHTHSSKAGILGRAAATGLSSSVVHSVHGWGHTPLDPPAKRMILIGAERALAPQADALIAVSSDVRDEGLALGIGLPDQYHVVPEYVDYSPTFADHAAARASARSVLDLPMDAVVAGWVGRFMPQKDPATLGRAMARALRTDRRLWAAFVGDGPDRALVERAMCEAGVLERCRFAGFRSDVRELYPSFDLLVHTSLYEGQPRVVQEAIAERIPVITARVSGTRDLLQSGRVGTEVQPGQPEQMAAEVIRRTADARLLAPLDDAAIAAVAMSNGRSASERGHRSLYRHLLAGSAKPLQAADPDTKARYD